VCKRTLRKSQDSADLGYFAEAVSIRDRRNMKRTIAHFSGSGVYQDLGHCFRLVDQTPAGEPILG